MESFGKSLGASTGCKVVTMKSGAAITALDCVAIDTGAVDPAQVIPCTNLLQPIGVALEAATGAGEFIAVAVSGKVENVTGDGTVNAAGTCLVADAAGVCTPYANTSVFVPFAISLEGDGGTTAQDIFIFGLGFETIGY